MPVYSLTAWQVLIGSGGSEQKAVSAVSVCVVLMIVKTEPAHRGTSAWKL